jgi:hypothetical protein
MTFPEHATMNRALAPRVLIVKSVPRLMKFRLMGSTSRGVLEGGIARTVPLEPNSQVIVLTVTLSRFTVPD